MLSYKVRPFSGNAARLMVLLAHCQTFMKLLTHPDPLYHISVMATSNHLVHKLHKCMSKFQFSWSEVMNAKLSWSYLHCSRGMPRIFERGFHWKIKLGYWDKAIAPRRWCCWWKFFSAYTVEYFWCYMMWLFY